MYQCSPWISLRGVHKSIHVVQKPYKVDWPHETSMGTVPFCVPVWKSFMHTGSPWSATTCVSLVPRPSTPPVFDCLQYAKTFLHTTSDQKPFCILQAIKNLFAYCKRSKTGGIEGLEMRLTCVPCAGLVPRLFPCVQQEKMRLGMNQPRASMCTSVIAWYCYKSLITV